jgi:hypothetical protein
VALQTTITRLLAQRVAPFLRSPEGGWTTSIGSGLKATLGPRGVTVHLPHGGVVSLSALGVSRGADPLRATRPASLLATDVSRLGADRPRRSSTGRDDSRQATEPATAHALSEDLGSLVESFHLTPQGIEQSFVVPSRPAGHGSQLTLVLGVSGTLRPSLSGPTALAFGVTSSHAAIAPLRYSGLRAVDAHGRSLPARFDLEQGRVRIVVDDAGATYPVRIDPTFGSGEDLSDGASAIAFSDNGDFALVGDDEAQPDTYGPDITPGAAFLMYWDGSSWTSTMLSDETISENCSGTECGYPNWDSGDDFGEAVALSSDGQYAVIGAPGAYGVSEGYGAVFVYAISLDGHTPTATLTSLLGQNTNGSDQFGASVAVTDAATGGVANPEIVVGAPHTDYYYTEGGTYTPTGSGSSGALFVYNDPSLLNYGNGNLDANRDGTGLYDSSAPAEGAELGTSVAIDSSGNLIVAGTPDYSSDGTSPEEGAVYAFDGESGSPDLVATGASTGDTLGQSVAVTPDGAEVAAGEPMLSTGQSPTPAGEVQILDPADSWSATAVSPATPLPGEAYGASVALSDNGQTLLVGAPYDAYYSRTDAYYESDTSPSDTTPGHAYVEQAVGGSFTAPSEQVLTPIGPDGEYFGAAVGLTGNASEAAVGASNDDNGPNFNAYDPGNTYLFAATSSGPMVSAIDPSYGAAGSSDDAEVEITGTGFTGASAVDFGSTAAASFSVVSDTEIEATPPSESAGTVDVTVTNSEGTSVTSSADEYEFLAFVPVPTGSTAGTLSGVSCLSPTDCLAVGSMQTDEGGEPLAEVFDGSSFQPITAPGGTGVKLIGVSCAGGDCMAVGWGPVSGYAVDGPYAAQWNGSSWTSQTLPTLSDEPEVELLGVSCTSATSCVAVGFAETSGCNDDSYCTYPVSASYDGSDWTSYTPLLGIQPDESEGETLNTLLSVSCVSSTSCTAVGYDDGDLWNGSAYQVEENALIETFDGSTWTIEPNPAYGTFAIDSQLFSVACVADGECSAVGSGPSIGTVIFAGEGSSWTAETQDSEYTEMQSVACDPDGVCIALPGGASTTAGVISGPDGYTTVPTTAASGGGSGLTAISCPAAGECVAVGGYGIDVSESGFPLAETDEPGSFAPQVVVVSPDSGPAGSPASDTSIDLYGVNFTGTTAVDFGSVAATSFDETSDGELVVEAPAQAAGTVDVTVHAPGGISATSSEDEYSYLAHTEITGIEPESTDYDQDVTISGASFTGATVVEFGSTPALSYDVVNDNEIDAVVPEGTGTVDVTVTSPAGTSSLSSADRYTFVSPPTVSSVSPDFGSAEQETLVTVTGNDFLTATKVVLCSGENNCQSCPEDNQCEYSTEDFTVVSDHELTFTVPGAGDLEVSTGTTFDVVVVGPGGPSTTSSADQFSLLGTPEVDSLSVSNGPNAGGFSVDIFGSGFTKATVAAFGSVPAESFEVENDREIDAVAPPGTGTVDVTVTTPLATSATSHADQFSYESPPVLTLVSPSVVSPAGGTVVTLTGSGFSELNDESAVYLVGFTAQAIDVGAGQFSVSSDTSMSFTAPTLPRGALSDLGVVVLSVDGSYPPWLGSSDALTSSDELTYGSVVLGLLPAAGPASGENQVVISGTGLEGAYQVDFGANQAPSFDVVSDEEIVATAPPGTLGNDEVEVLTSAGTSIAEDTGDDIYSYVAPPVVTGVSPNSAEANDVVTISGSDFSTTTRVDFESAGGGDLAPYSYDVVSDDEITARVPDGSGTVDVLVTNAAGTSAPGSADQFTFIPLNGPVVPASSPSPVSSTGHSPASSGAGSTEGSSGSGLSTTLAGLAQVADPSLTTATAPAGRVALHLELSCPRGRTCTGSAVLVLDAPSARRAASVQPIVLATSSFRISAGHRATLTWTLSNKAARLLADAGHDRLVVDLRSGRRVSSQPVTVLRAARHT